MTEERVWIKTPLLESVSMSKICGVPCYLKLENVQPSGSYKIRGLSNLILKNKANGISQLVSASGGNAGMSAAYTGKILGIPTTVVIPESTPKLMIEKLESEGAEVKVVGKVWNEAQETALELSKDESTLYVHPYHHPYIWEGIEEIVYEVIEHCSEKISAIALSVGGGGLLCGVLQGLQKKGLKIPVIAMETEGANCFNAALKAGKPVSIGNITSIAKTLGALSVTPRVFDLLPNSEVISKVVTDREALNACLQFLDESRFLVEPACGATLCAGYSNIISELVKEGKIDKDGAVIFIVCGGNGVTMDQMKEWKTVVGI